MTIGVARFVVVAGVSGHVVEMHADLGHGLPSVTVIGDELLAESRDRVRAAIANSGEQWPDARLVVASSVPVTGGGGGHDVALAVAVLAASGAIPAQTDSGTVFIGGLCLDGRLQGERAILPAVLAARENHYRSIVVPEPALAQLGLVEGIDIVGAADLRAVLGWLRQQQPLPGPDRAEFEYPPPATDLANLVGRPYAKWALEVAAAGGHHLAIVGRPGSGKTLLAQCLPGILPPLTDTQALDVAAIASAAGDLGRHSASRMPPLVTPHHSTSTAAMLGGGSRAVLPGVVSRAHHGVLFLDEVTELSSRVREALRVPLDEGRVRIGRLGSTVSYPARFQLIVAASVCPCSAVHEGDCVCSPQARLRYLSRFAEPWTDLLDIWVDLSPKVSQLDTAVGETSVVVRGRVAAARAAAAQRWQEHGCLINADVPADVLRQQFRLAPSILAPIQTAVRTGRLSARGADRVLRLAWTLCDLRAGATPNEQDIDDALMLRQRPPLSHR
ncbi:YifB family Mg chelatase-like AAA ATPase [Nocardia suismassiliense]|uniref:YifB family Mg chelatase-like AAA ATPase n=1 Tax=Nocardia suismassiliense TaxID=2077092 RepID=UPI000D1E5DB0|nr:ATP-binding protein [Nocardia suismassiliense]